MKKLLLIFFSAFLTLLLSQSYAQDLEIKCEVLHGIPYTPPTLSFLEGDTLNLVKLELKGKWEGTDAPSATQALNWFKDTNDDCPFAPLDWTGIVLDTTWTDNGDGTFSQKHELKKVYQNSAWAAAPVTAGWMAEDSVYTIELQSVISGAATTFETFTFETAGTVDFGKAEYKLKYEGKKTGDSITLGKAEAGLSFQSAARKIVMPTGTEFLRINFMNTAGTFYTVDFPVVIVTPDDLGLNVAITPEAYPAVGFFPGGDTIDVQLTLTNDGGTELNWAEGPANGLEKIEFFFSGPKQDYEYIYEKVKVIDKFVLKDDPATGQPFTSPLKLVLPDTLPGTGTYTFLAKVKRVFSGSTEKVALADIQVGSATVTNLPVGNCETCHTGADVLTRHNSVGVDQCLVCHVDDMGAAFSLIAHSSHMTSPKYPGRMDNCTTCHVNDSQDQFTSDAVQVCTACHNPVPYLPTDHNDVPLFAESGMTCATLNCHSGGGLGVFQTIKTTHAGIAGKYTGGTLVASSTTTAPALDGDIDAVWNNATSITTLKGVELKALYDDNNLFMLAQWTDGHNLKTGTAGPTESVDKNLWTFADTSWTKSGNEDRLAFLWDAGDSFGASCSNMCHSDGSHKTSDGNADVWHWKAARTNPLSLTDDKWWSNAGRGSDTKTVGAYNDNVNATGDAPMYSGPITDGHFIIVPVGGSTADLETTINVANTYPGYYLDANAEGSRWDVKSVGKFDAQNGTWTVEFQRTLDTSNLDDVVFTHNSSIKFTTATFDNTGGGHASQGIDVGVYSLEIGPATSVEEERTTVPDSYELTQNYPNPFNPSTTINFSLKKAGHVKMVIYNVLGEEVKKVIDKDMSAGHHRTVISAQDMASGIYFYKIMVNDFTAVKKMAVMK